MISLTTQCAISVQDHEGTIFIESLADSILYEQMPRLNSTIDDTLKRAKSEGFEEIVLKLHARVVDSGLIGKLVTTNRTAKEIGVRFCVWCPRGGELSEMLITQMNLDKVLTISEFDPE